MDEHFTCIVNTESRWSSLCSLLDDNQLLNLFNSHFSTEEPTSMVDGVAFGSSPSRELLHRWKTNTNATTAKLLEILSKIQHSDAVSLIQSWLHEYSESIEHVSKKQKTTHQKEDVLLLYEQGMEQYWKGCNDKAIYLFKKCVDMKFPPGYLRLYRLTKKEDDRVQSVPFKNWFMERAITGDSQNEYLMGFYFEMIEKDFIEAMNWYRKAADKNFAPAQNCIATLLDKGEAVPQDRVQAVEWYRKAADQGLMVAQCNLAVCYRDGKGVPLDLKEAEAWFLKAADQGHVSAQFRLGVLYDEQQKVDLAFQWYSKAAEQGNIMSIYNVGSCYASGAGVKQNWEKAFEWFHKAKELGDTDATNYIGWCYLNGRGTAKDYHKAIEMFRTAAPNSDIAQYNLGLCYHEGYGVTKDYVHAFSWYQKSASKGNDGAQFEMGLAYLNGWGIRTDTEAAIEWLTKSASQGNHKAEHKLGFCYYHGIGVHQNYETAVSWYQKASSHFSEAAYGLARCYEYGEGVPLDFTEAIKLLRSCRRTDRIERDLNRIQEVTKMNRCTKQETE